MPLAISSHDIPPMLRTAAPISVIAAPTATRATALTNMFCGMICMAPAMIPSAIAMAPSPVANCARSIPPKSPTALANIFIAAPRITKPVAVPIIPAELPVSFMNPASVARTTATEPRPLPRDAISNDPKSATALAKTFNAAARTTMPAALTGPKPLKSVILRNPARAPKTTMTPDTPLANDAKSRAPSAFTASARIRMAVATRIRPTAPLVRPPPTLERPADAATSAPRSTVTPTRPRASSPQSRPERVLTDAARIPMATPRTTNTAAALLTPVKPFFDNRSNSAKDPMS